MSSVLGCGAESPGDQYPMFHLEIPYPTDESISLTWAVGQQTPMKLRHIPQERRPQKSKPHLFFILAINQLDAQNLFYNKFISCLYMFRAPCARRQEVKNCIIHALVSSHL